MTDSTPDYSEYTSEELLEIYINMNKEQEPEKAKAIEAEIKLKMDKTSAAPKPIMSLENKWGNTGRWFNGILIAIFILLVASKYLFRPAPPDVAEIKTYMVWNLTREIIIFSILGYGVFKQNVPAIILLVLYFFLLMFGSLIF